MHQFGLGRGFVRLLVVSSLIAMAMQYGLPFAVGAAPAAGGQTIDGVFTTIDGDPRPGTGGAAREIYFVTDAKGVKTQLILSEQVAKAAGGVLALDRKQVSVVVDPAPAAGVQNGGAPARTVISIGAVPGAKKLSAPTGGPQPFINIMCKFSDDATEPVTSGYIQNNLFAATAPGLNAYWIENSYGNINLNGTGTVGWFTLPSPRGTYIVGQNANLDLLVTDCTGLALASVTFPNYIGFNLIFNGLLDNAAWGGTTFLTIQGTQKLWAVTWSPPWGYFPNGDPINLGQTFLAHETGHAFGLKHSGNNTGATYQNGWDPMSAAQWHCDLLNDPVVGCRGRDGIAFDKDLNGWIGAADKYNFTGTANQGALPFALTNLAGGHSAGTLLEITIPQTGGATQFTTLEMRNQFGNDAKNPAPAVIIHDIDTTRQNPAWVQGTDGYDGAKFLAGSSYPVPNSGGVKVAVSTLAANSAIVWVGFVPQQATGIQVTGATASSVSFGWIAPDATSYTTVTNGTTAVNLNPGVATFTQNGLASGQTTCISTLSFNGIGPAAAGGTAWVCGQSSPGAPPVVTNLVKTAATQATVTFSWDAVAPSTYIAVSNGAAVTGVGYGATSYPSPTAAGAWTCLSVLAANASGFSAWSSWACGFARPPAPVVSYGGVHTTTSVTFSWAALPPSTAISVSDGVTVTNSFGTTTYTKSGMVTGSWVCVSALAYNSQENSAPWTPWVCGQAV